MVSPADRRSSRSARRLGLGVRIAVTLPLIAIVLVADWLLSHVADRSEVFSTRRTPITAVERPASPTTTPAYITESVRLSTAGGLTVDLRVLRPAQSDGPLPLVVLLGGHRTGRDAVDLVSEVEGMVVAALDYPYHGPERVRGAAQVLRAIPEIQQALLDTPPAVSVALDWLIEQPWVDATRVELMGVSLGVPFAAVAGALDERFRRVWLIHGGVDNRAWLANRLEPKIENRLVRETLATLLHLLAYGPTFRTEKWAARIAPRSLVIVGARDDEQMPPANVRQLHAAAGEPKELLWTEGRHVGPRRPEIVQQLLALVRSRIVEPTTGTRPAASK